MPYKDPEKAREHQRAYRATNKEKHRAENARYYATHHKREYEKRKAYSKSVRGKEQQQAYLEKNREKKNAYAKQYREANKERINAAQRAKYANNPEYYRANFRKTKYKLSPIEYYTLLERQCYQCAICGNWLDLSENTHIDHCHDTNKVRGVLCSFCNRGIGMFKHDVTILQKAISYLEE